MFDQKENKSFAERRIYAWRGLSVKWVEVKDGLFKIETFYSMEVMAWTKIQSEKCVISEIRVR